ncbi:MAG: polysaccharide pyruvyl transferase family protein [Oceanicaulis sp.]|nr:polysaccharide pyruvyl transferase family protein [Oceanicaulis sp.]
MSQQDHYAIIGGTLWGKRGAEAMVCTTMARVREKTPDSRFVLMSYYPAADRKLAAGADHVTVDNAIPRMLLLVYMPFAMLVWLFGLVRLRFPDSLMPARVRRLRACKALLDVSGISFHDGRIGVLIYNVFCIWPALLMKVPVIHLSQARGPFNNPLNKLLSKLFLSACTMSWARGRVTAQYMRELGLPEDRWGEAADIAFSFRDGNSITTENPERSAALLVGLEAAKTGGKLVVGVSPSSVVLAKTEKLGIDYPAHFARLVTHLVASGHHVVLLPNATREGGEGLRNNDIPVLVMVHERLSPEVRAAVSLVDFDVNTDTIRAIISSCVLLVTSRFHAMVAGLSLVVPVFVVGWSHKYGEVLEMFDCPDDAIDFAGLSEGLIPAVDTMLTAREDRAARIAKALPRVQSSSLRQFEVL